MLKILNWTSIPVLKYINSPKIKKNNEKNVGNCSIYSSSLLCWNVLLIYKRYICTLHANNKPPEIGNLVAGKYNFMITKAVLVTINSPLMRVKWRPLIGTNPAVRFLNVVGLLPQISLSFSLLYLCIFQNMHMSFCTVFSVLCFHTFSITLLFWSLYRYLPSVLSTYIAFLRHIH